MVHTVTLATTDPARPSTLEGATTHCPAAALARIALACDTSVDSLSTLTVKKTAGPLYDAILAYAAQGPVPLLVRHVQEDKDEDEDPEKLFRRFRGEIRPTAGTGLKHKHAPVPLIELGTSECSVQWPPAKWHKTPAIDGEAVDGAIDAEEQVGKFKVSIVHYSVGDPKATECSLSTYEEITLACVDREHLLQFTHEVLEWHHEMKQKDMKGKSFALHRFKITFHGRGWWESEGMKRARKAESVILAEGQIEAILNDVEHFMSVESREWYIGHGLPHRRSYLFYGPPGTGKTSTIRVIAGKFGLNCCYLSMVNKDFSNQLLGDALSQVPANALIVLEDVDALFKERKNEDQNALTFSGLLNSLDGLISADGVIVVMTTNHIENLDQALIRGGRVDRRFYFPKPENDQIGNLFKAYYPKSPDSIVDEFVQKVREREEKEAGSISTLQQLFIEMRTKGAEQCVREVHGFFERHFPKVIEGQ